MTFRSLFHALPFFRSKQVNPVSATESTLNVLSAGTRPRTFGSEQALAQYKSWVYTCANLNAIALAQAQLRLYAKRGTGQPYPKLAPWCRVDGSRQSELRKQFGITDTTELVEITEHPFLDLMQNINPFRNHFDFFEETSVFLDCTGNTFWYIVEGKGLTKGIPQELWILPSQNVVIVPDEKDFLKGYLYGKYGKQIALTAESVIHFRRPNIRDQFYGMGRIEAEWVHIQSANALDEFEYSQADGRGVQDLLINYKQGSLTKAQKRELISDFMSAMRQAKRDPRPFLADGDMTVEKISWSPRELLALSSRSWSREGIITAFGQTTAMYTETATRANIEGALYKWQRFEVDPTCTRIAEKLNEQLLPRYDGQNLLCAFDVQASRDREYDLRQETADITGHIRTINEIRKSRGLPVVDDERADDLFFAPVPASSFGNPNPFAPEVIEENEKVFDGRRLHKHLAGVPVFIAQHP